MGRTLDALKRLMDVAQKWQTSCVCATQEDHDEMDTAIALAEEAVGNGNED